MMITGDDAKRMGRFEFIAHWLVAVTKRKANRGPLGYWVRRLRKRWQVVARDTVVYETPDPDRLFDFARRTELGHETRKADNFRVDAYS